MYVCIIVQISRHVWYFTLYGWSYLITVIETHYLHAILLYFPCEIGTFIITGGYNNNMHPEENVLFIYSYFKPKKKKKSVEYYKECGFFF